MLALRTELISFRPQPSKFRTRRSVLSRSNSILPVVSCDEIPTWVADHGNVEVAKGREDVSPVAMGV